MESALIGGGVVAVVTAVVVGLVQLVQWIIWLRFAARVSATLGVEGLKELPALARAMSWTGRPSRAKR